jgi:hypothetical protein
MSANNTSTGWQENKAVIASRGSWHQLAARETGSKNDVFRWPFASKRLQSSQHLNFPTSRLSGKQQSIEETAQKSVCFRMRLFC